MERLPQFKNVPAPEYALGWTKVFDDHVRCKVVGRGWSINVLGFFNKNKTSTEVLEATKNKAKFLCLCLNTGPVKVEAMIENMAAHEKQISLLPETKSRFKIGRKVFYW